MEERPKQDRCIPAFSAVFRRNLATAEIEYAYIGKIDVVSTYIELNL